MQKNKDKNKTPFFPDRAINPSRRFRPTEDVESVYTFLMTLTIIDVKESDFGNYSCQARNSLGTATGTIELLSKIGAKPIKRDKKF